MSSSGAGELVLAVDDNADALYTLEQVLVHNGFRVITATNGEEAVQKAAEYHPAVALLDVMMPEVDGYRAVERFKADSELRFIPVILLTARDSLEDIVKGLDRGADDYILKPFQPEQLLARLRAALRLSKTYDELRKSERQRSALLRELNSKFNFANIVGQSPPMRKIFSLLEKIVDVESPVLISGPSGTGKELVARAIHFNSRRKNAPFVAVNCAAINENLLESELFGHLRGAFTGAIRDKVGLFEAADGGTLFLDEIGEMAASLQAKLLRVLQESAVMPVGSTEEKKVDVRILAATNRDLSTMVEQGKFRDDLYYRLNVIDINLPALSSRREDILPIAESILTQVCEKRRLPVKRFSKDAARMLQAYSWRGNVRELENEIERMMILAENEEELGVDFLSSRIIEEYYKKNRPAASSFEEETSLKRAVEALERRMIADALKRHKGNKSVAAKELGISRSNLIAKVQMFGLEAGEEES